MLPFLKIFPTFSVCFDFNPVIRQGHQFLLSLLSLLSVIVTVLQGLDIEDNGSTYFGSPRAEPVE